MTQGCCHSAVFSSLDAGHHFMALSQPCTCTQTHTHTHTHTDTHAHTDTHRHTYTHRHTDTHAHTYTQRHTDTHAHTYTHTQTHTQSTSDQIKELCWARKDLTREACFLSARQGWVTGHHTREYRLHLSGSHPSGHTPHYTPEGSLLS